MPHSINRRRRWSDSKLDPFEDFIIAERRSGQSLRAIRDQLAELGLKVHVATLSRFLKGLPPLTD